MILFLHGKDTYRSKQKLREIKEKFKREVDPQGYNLTVIDGQGAAMTDLADALNAMPFMAAKRMVVVESLSKVKLSDEEEQALVSIIESIIEDDTILVVWEEELNKTEQKKVVMQAVSKTKYVIPFVAWTQSQVAGWINQELEKSGIAIDSTALNYLSAYVNDDLWVASLEVGKLINFAQANKKDTITLGDIKLLTPSGAQDNIFALVDAISSGNTKDALKRLGDQEQSGSHPLEIMGMIVRQFRLIQQIKSGFEQGKSADVIAKDYKIHPFVVKKMSNQSQRISQESIQYAYKQLADVDVAIKSVGIKAEVLLDQAVGKVTSEL